LNKKYKNLKQNQESFRQIVKATSLFGGVQVINIVISVIRSKIIAVLLGPAGMGISGLLTSTVGLISGLTNFGLGTSAVKNVSEANSSGNHHRIAVIIKVLKRCLWITGGIGALLAIVLSDWLSNITFGNSEYRFAFVYLSLSILMNQLASGQLAILQGVRNLKKLAKANLVGNFGGLIVTVPLYYFWGIQAIVPALVGSSFIALICSVYFSRKLGISPVDVSYKRTYVEGKKMLVMGFMISLSGLITVGVSYLVRIYISTSGGLQEVGLYTAGIAIINTYVGMVFSSMATDYYPRLASVANSNADCAKTINEQAEIAVLILSPIVLFFLVFIDFIILALYSNKFLAISGMLHWAIIGTLFRASNWSIGFVFLAKGESKLFFIIQLIINMTVLVLNIVVFRMCGLIGLGIAFMFSYIINLVQVYSVSYFKYKFRYNASFIKVFLVQLALSFACMLVVKLTNSYLSYFFGIMLFGASVTFSVIELNHRINLKMAFLNTLNKIKRSGK
jgi:O-antigen/teichoic acid export membrane protein